MKTIVMGMLLMVLWALLPAAAAESQHGEAGTLQFPGGQIIVRWYKYASGTEYGAIGLFRLDGGDDEKAVIFLDRKQWRAFTEAYNHAVARWNYATDVLECMGTVEGFNGDDEETIAIFLGKKAGNTTLEIRIQPQKGDPVAATVHYSLCPHVARLIALLNEHFNW